MSHIKPVAWYCDNVFGDGTPAGRTYHDDPGHLGLRKPLYGGDQIETMIAVHENLPEALLNTVPIATVQHRHGSNLYMGESTNDIERQLREYVGCYWEDAFPDGPTLGEFDADTDRDYEDPVEAYFDNHPDETYQQEEVHIPLIAKLRTRIEELEKKLNNIKKGGSAS